MRQEVKRRKRSNDDQGSVNPLIERVVQAFEKDSNASEALTEHENEDQLFGKMMCEN